MTASSSPSGRYSTGERDYLFPYYQRYADRPVCRNDGGRNHPERYLESDRPVQRRTAYVQPLRCRSGISRTSPRRPGHDLHAVGVARAMVYYDHKGVAITSHGESATSEGYVYEAINGASNEQLPVIFVLQDNGYGISVPKRIRRPTAR